VYHPAANTGDSLADAPPRGSQQPGTYYLYSNWDFNAAGTAFERQTGLNLFDALHQDLAVPLGFQDFDRSAHRKGGDRTSSMHPSYHMHLSTRDMARIGFWCCARDDGRTSRSSRDAGLRIMTSAITPVGEMNPENRRQGLHGYGYMWWVWDDSHNRGPFAGAVTARGLGGQYITVLPALDMVVAKRPSSAATGVCGMRTSGGCWSCWCRNRSPRPRRLEAPSVNLTSLPDLANLPDRPNHLPRRRLGQANEPRALSCGNDVVQLCDRVSNHGK
jgi:CubicO group peptidase (beta-lactamase class C family)